MTFWLVRQKIWFACFCCLLRTTKQLYIVGVGVGKNKNILKLLLYYIFFFKKNALIRKTGSDPQKNRRVALWNHHSLNEW